MGVNLHVSSCASLNDGINHLPINVCIRAVTQNIFTYEDDFGGIDAKACTYVVHCSRPGNIILTVFTNKLCQLEYAGTVFIRTTSQHL